MSASNPANAPTPTQAQSRPASVSVGVGGLRYPSNKKSIYDRNRDRSKNAESSRAAFAYMFVEMIRYQQSRVRDIGELETNLNLMGYPLGIRLLDLLVSRNTASPSQPSTTRPLRILSLLQFITTTLWRHLFGRPADALEQSIENPHHYMVFDNAPFVSQYISVPRETKDFNPNAFVAGVIEGVCDAAGFQTTGKRGVGVSAHWAGAEGEAAGAGMWPDRTVFLVKFSDGVVEREEILGKGEK